jgi:hypothetical protein
MVVDIELVEPDQAAHFREELAHLVAAVAETGKRGAPRRIPVEIVGEVLQDSVHVSALEGVVHTLDELLVVAVHDRILSPEAGRKVYLRHPSRGV